MSKRDAVYWGGLMVGLIIGMTVLSQLGVTGIFQFIGALVIGVGVGFVAEKAIMGGN